MKVLFKLLFSKKLPDISTPAGGPHAGEGRHPGPGGREADLPPAPRHPPVPPAAHRRAAAADGRLGRRDDLHRRRRSEIRQLFG